LWVVAQTVESDQREAWHVPERVGECQLRRVRELRRRHDRDGRDGAAECAARAVGGHDELIQRDDRIARDGRLLRGERGSDGRDERERRGEMYAATDLHRLNLRDLNFRVCPSIAGSVARRSMLDAPKKPATPRVRSSTYCASSGCAMGPP